MKIENYLYKNRLLKNLYSGRRCFIIGNGPSVNLQDLSLLQNEITIVTNSFHRHVIAKNIKSQFWVMADPYIWLKPEEFFIPQFEYFLSLDIYSKLFIPSGGLQYFLSLKTPPLVDLHFYHFDYSKTYKTMIDFSHGISPYAQNVIMISMMLAFYMGCNPVYLIGCDHDFMKFTKKMYEKNIVKHFYSDIKAEAPGSRMSWEVWQKSMKNMDYMYDQLKLYASCWGYDVFNATKGGSLEAFERVKYESLFPSLQMDVSFFSPAEPDSSGYIQTARKLLKDGNYHSALVLINEALKKNINSTKRKEGLQYLKAICLEKTGKYDEAFIFARQDYDCNPNNRLNSKVLINRLKVKLDKISIDYKNKINKIKIKKGLSLEYYLTEYKRASDFQKSGSLYESNAIFKELLKCHKDEKFLSGVCFHLGEIFYYKNKIVLAKKYFKKCMNFCPEHLKAKEYLNTIKNIKRGKK